MYIALDKDDYQNIDHDKLKSYLINLGYTKYAADGNLAEYWKSDFDDHVIVPKNKTALDYADLIKCIFKDISKALKIPEIDIYNKIMETELLISKKESGSAISLTFDLIGSLYKQSIGPLFIQSKKEAADIVTETAHTFIGFKIDNVKLVNVKFYDELTHSLNGTVVNNHVVQPSINHKTGKSKSVAAVAKHHNISEDTVIDKVKTIIN